MRRRFGDHARRARGRLDLSLKEVANALGVTITYVSEIELGRRNPPAPEMVSKWAHFLGEDEGLFDALARLDRRKIELEVDPEKFDGAQSQFAVALARSWQDLTDDDFRVIHEALEKRRERSQ